MGWGDDIMATAQAKQLHDKTGCRAFFNYWSEIWEGNPNISKTEGVYLENKKGCRPYILVQTQTNVIFNPNYHAIPGEIYLNDNDKVDCPEDFILVEPHVKQLFYKQNKDWGWDKWQELVKRIDCYQLDYGAPLLDNVKPIKTENFRQACYVLSKSKLFIGTDGGLHHAAAALKKDAVVLWSGFSHPKHVGYSDHLNLRADNSEPCGAIYHCPHCKLMMDYLTVDFVHDAISAKLG